MDLCKLLYLIVTYSLNLYIIFNYRKGLFRKPQVLRLWKVIVGKLGISLELSKKAFDKPSPIQKLFKQDTFSVSNLLNLGHSRLGDNS